MNERAREFLKNASADEGLRGKLDALAGLPVGELAEKTAAVAREAGFDLEPEDFAPADTELDEDELNAIAGGYVGEMCEESGDGYIPCTCTIEGWGEVLHDGWASELYCVSFGFEGSRQPQ